jgi:transposase
MPSSKLTPLNLTEAERRVLAGWARSRKTPQALAMRSRIVLACNAGGTNSEVAAALGTSRDMVSTWRSRFLRDRLDGLSDAPRPGRPRSVTADQIGRLIAKALETGPNAEARWSTRSLAAATGMSQSTASRICRAFGFTPGRNLQIEAGAELPPHEIRDVAGLYLRPAGRALALCGGEADAIRQLGRPEPVMLRRLQTPDVAQHGTAGLFDALQIAVDARVDGEPGDHQDFLRFLHTVDKIMPPQLQVRVITSGTIARLELPQVLYDRVHLHRVPTVSTWLTLAQRSFVEMSVQLLRWENRSVAALENEIRQWVHRGEQHSSPFLWMRPVVHILESLHCTLPTN